MDWLTWQAIRDLAAVEVVKDGERVRYMTPRQPRDYVIRLGWPRAVREDQPVSPGAVLYARDAWRAPWRASLRRVPNPCVLVTVFHDAHVRAHAATGLLDGTAIHRWFAVQVQTEHPRIVPMPIGIDGRDLAALTMAPRWAWNDRDISCLVNFQPRNAERKALLRSCRDRSWMTVTPWERQAPMSQAAYYAQLGRARFVLSPPGRGWDCYRTYEAIAMGAIPIVRRDAPLSDVVNGLPVVVVDDWHEVTPERLRWEDAHRHPAPDLSRLTSGYWRTQIQAAATAAKESSDGTNLQSEA